MLLSGKMTVCDATVGDAQSVRESFLLSLDLYTLGLSFKSILKAITAI